MVITVIKSNGANGASDAKEKTYISIHSLSLQRIKKWLQKRKCWFHYDSTYLVHSCLCRFSCCSLLLSSTLLCRRNLRPRMNTLTGWQGKLSTAPCVHLGRTWLRTAPRPHPPSARHAAMIITPSCGTTCPGVSTVTPSALGTGRWRRSVQPKATGSVGANGASIWPVTIVPDTLSVHQETESKPQVIFLLNWFYSCKHYCYYLLSYDAKNTWEQYSSQSVWEFNRITHGIFKIPFFFLLGTPLTNTVCEECSDGYFSNASSAFDPCVKHQECANGNVALLPGSIYHDTVCGSCEDLTREGEGFFVCIQVHINSNPSLILLFPNNISSSNAIIIIIISSETQHCIVVPCSG